MSDIQEAYEDLYATFEGMARKAQRAHAMNRPDLIQHLIDLVTGQYMLLSARAEQDLNTDGDDIEDFCRLFWITLDMKDLLRDLTTLKENCHEPDNG